MPKALNFQLTEEGLREIVEALKHDKRPEVRQRAMGLRWLQEGKSPKEVAEFLGVSQPTVYDWHRGWQREGVEGLANRLKSGRPANATDRYVAQLEEAVEQDPQDLGYAFSIWTTE